MIVFYEEDMAKQTAHSGWKPEKYKSPSWISDEQIAV